ncbi:hypothetical protein ACIRYZ_15770 [Kitasatospora sp. NPDC101155]|uniref:hypothetical protein n=1 Tax=Kitasatospora sp. NPDC101155 TaxID=3364097 RepID=UPI00380802BE
MKAKKTMRHMAMTAVAGVLALAGTMATAGTAQADITPPQDAPRVDVNAPMTLLPGQYIDTGSTRLILQDDGNLVTYKTYNGQYTPVWSAPGSWGCGAKAILQPDGNFVVYGSDSRVCWTSNTMQPNNMVTLEIWGYGGLKLYFGSPARSLSWAVIASTDPY